MSATTSKAVWSFRGLLRHPIKTTKAVRAKQKEPPYEEKFILANGKHPTKLGGYARLTRGYDMRNVRDVPRPNQDMNLVFYNHLTWTQRFFSFMVNHKKRLWLIVLGAVTFSIYGLIGGFISRTLERQYKRWWWGYRLKHYPESVTYESALQTTFEP